MQRLKDLRRERGERGQGSLSTVSERKEEIGRDEYAVDMFCSSRLFFGCGSALSHPSEPDEGRIEGLTYEAFVRFKLLPSRLVRARTTSRGRQVWSITCISRVACLGTRDGRFVGVGVDRVSIVAL